MVYIALTLWLVIAIIAATNANAVMVKLAGEGIVPVHPGWRVVIALITTLCVSLVVAVVGWMIFAIGWVISFVGNCLIFLGKFLALPITSLF